MNYPNFNEEKKLWNQGFKCVVGLDEAGRGPLAGPIVAAAIFVKKKCYLNLKINDSKKLSEKQREYFYRILTNHPQISWGVGMVSEKVIDKINILEATKLAMQRAIINVKNSLSPFSHGREKMGINLGADYLLIDGNFAINSNVQQKSIIRGDQKVFSIAAAGIIAKVTRDLIMQQMHKKYPEYHFNQHKGYGTKLHINSLHSFGPCKIHRKSFFPVKTLARSQPI